MGIPEEDFTNAVKVTSCEIAEGLTLEVSLVLVPSFATLVLAWPLIELLAASVAARVCVPKVLSVAENVLVPLVRVEFAGKTAAGSLLLKCTVPL